MNRKDVILAVLTTFCLCALMFSVIPIRSQQPSQQPYDPWADIDENGKINMYDIGYEAQRFNTAGDSTKNVNVTNWPQGYSLYQYPYGPNNVSFNIDISFEALNVSGYSRIYVIPEISNMSSGTYSVNVTVHYAFWSANGWDYSEEMSMGNNVFVIKRDATHWFVTGVNIVPIEAEAPSVSFQFTINSNAVGWMLFNYEVYLRNE